MGSAAGGLKVIGEEGEFWLLISAMLSMKKYLHFFFFFIELKPKVCGSFLKLSFPLLAFLVLSQIVWKHIRDL